MGTKICYASPTHPQSNGQVECANTAVLNGLKTRAFDRLHARARQWIEELPMVLWSIQTTPGRATGETPFFLVYGAKAVLPSELTFGSPRTSQYTKSEQDDRRLDDINFIEELRCRAALRAARYHQAATMSVRSRADPLLLATWCSIASRREPAKTSYPPAGRAPTPL